MMAAAQCHTALVGYRHRIVRVDAVEEEADQTRAADGRVGTEEPDAFKRGQLLECIGAEFLVVLRDAIAANMVEIVHGGVQPDGTGNVRRAGFEFVRRVFPRALMIIDGENHLAAALIRRGFFEPFAPAIQNPKAGRTAHFMRGEREEIAADLLHVDGAMARTLRRIDECDDSTPTGAFAVFGDGIDRAERIGNVRYRQQLHVAGEKLVEPAEIKQAGVTVDREKDELCAGALSQELPRHDVAVVLYLGEQDFVAALDELGAPRCGDEVDALGGAAGEDDFVGAASVEEFRGADAGRFERDGGAVA